MKKGRFRSAMERLFDINQTDRRSTIIKSDPSQQVYRYNSPERVDSKFVRKLYRNQDQRYVFGAQLIKPVIDSNVSFIGIPRIRSSHEKTNEQLNYLVKKIPFADIHRIAEREGTCYVWPQWDEDKIKFVILPNETVEETYIEPITKNIIGYHIIEKFSYLEPNNTSPINMIIKMDVFSDKVIRNIEGDKISMNGRKVIKNPFGFIPIIDFKNDNEPWEKTGHSEIENIEPQVKLYHDVTLEAMHAQKRDGHPKAKIKTNSPKEWVDNNYGSGTFNRLLAGEGYISLKDRDLFICKTGGINEKDEDIEYIEANKTTGDYGIITEKTFTNIVEGAQTPEIIFGANMGTSLASVKEQRPAFIKKIEKKQRQYEEHWRKLIEASLIITGFATFEEFDKDLEFIWPIPDFSSDKEKAETFNVITNALTKMKSAYLMSDKEIHNTIKKFDIIDVEQDYDVHYEEIEKTAEDIAKRMEDEIAAKNLEMNQRIATGEYDENATRDI